jgi:multiple sugar transport system permease protein
VLAAVAIFSFQGAWDDFLGPLIFLGGNSNLYTLTIGLYSFISAPHGLNGEVLTQYMMAMAVMMIAPLMLTFALGQRYFVQGVTMTGLKV